MYDLPEVVIKLNQNGWAIDRIHPDGVIDMTRSYVNGEKIRLFVSGGQVGIPRTWATVRAADDLKDINSSLGIPWGPDGRRRGEKYKIFTNGGTVSEGIDLILQSAAGVLSPGTSSDFESGTYAGILLALESLLSASETPAEQLLDQYLEDRQ